MPIIPNKIDNSTAQLLQFLTATDQLRVGAVSESTSGAVSESTADAMSEALLRFLYALYLVIAHRHYNEATTINNIIDHDG